MIRIAFRLAVALLCCFGALVAVQLIRPQARIEPPAYLLPPEGCPAPCFLGIRPGITGGGDAITLLQQLGWFGYVDGASFESGIEFFSWRGHHGDVMDSWEWGSVRVEDNIVRSLSIPTRLRLGDILILYGQADMWSFGESGRNAGFASYHDHHLVVWFLLPGVQPQTYRRALWSPVTLYYRTERMY